MQHGTLSHSLHNHITNTSREYQKWHTMLVKLIKQPITAVSTQQQPITFTYCSALHFIKQPITAVPTQQQPITFSPAAHQTASHSRLYSTTANHIQPCSSSDRQPIRAVSTQQQPITFSLAQLQLITTVELNSFRGVLVPLREHGISYNQYE